MNKNCFWYYKENLDSTKNATADLEELVTTFQEQFSSQTDYLSLLVKAFDNILASDTHKHLNLFYYMVPPLLMNYIEHILINKEKLIKKSCQDVFLTVLFIFYIIFNKIHNKDDGFPMGCAYFLKILKMDKLYDGLHWEEVVRKRFSTEIKENTKETREKRHSVTKRQVEEVYNSLK